MNEHESQWLETIYWPLAIAVSLGRGFSGMVRTNSVPGVLLSICRHPCSCCENESTKRIPNRRPDFRSKPGGRPTPSSLTDMITLFSGPRDNVTQTRQ